MTNLLKIPTWADEETIHAIVETPRGSTCKLDFDPELRVFTLAKPLMAGLTDPYDWGFIPSTKAQDGDPLDVLVIHDARSCFCGPDRSALDQTKPAFALGGVSSRVLLALDTPSTGECKLPRRGSLPELLLPVSAQSPAARR
jgi:hypothetical protein